DKNKPTYLRITDINDDGTINFLDLKSVDDEDSNKYLLKENDIVFARTGNSTGRSYFYQKEHGDFVYAGFLIKFSIDPQKVNPKILKYYTHSQEYYNWVKSFDTGGTRGNINAKTFGDMPISLPKRCVQDKIVGILSALDSKIENNNKINANLEAQAEALFKSWFVDFTPFKDQPFVDSELGPIPQGWKVGKLGDIGEIVGGSTPSKSKPEYYTTHGIAWLTPKDLSTSKAKFTSRGEIDITDEGYNSTSTKLMPRGSVLFSSRAPIGYLTIAKNEICTNQGFKSLVPNGAGTGFIYYTLRHLTPQIENRATGSTFKEASATLMRSVETIVPPTSILNKFEELLRPILQFQEKKEEENQRLAALRDTLLPKLMSGEIKL
ncbi:MAG: restriction endonuclease subunit S, partial [Sodaliphilus sp.]|nr:restriction endonuclease subunit S [Sodaliphilus sp.]